MSRKCRAQLELAALPIDGYGQCEMVARAFTCQKITFAQMRRMHVMDLLRHAVAVGARNIRKCDAVTLAAVRRDTHVFDRQAMPLPPAALHLGQDAADIARL